MKKSESRAEPEVLYALDEGVARITINRPAARNALNEAVLTGLRESLARAAADPAARVVSLTGAGTRVFCAGADLKAARASAASGSAPDFGRGAFRQLLVDLAEHPKPTVALARGHVLAGGLGILLACDLALACDDIHLSTPEINVGMFPMMVLALLVRHVGRKRAAELVLLGENISAAEAERLGLVNRVYERAAFDAAADEVVSSLAAKSSHILRLGKEAMQRVEGLRLREALEHLESALAGVMSSEDSREGIRAFVEKRRPEWRDR